MDACVFCEIVTRRRAAHIVHETATAVAFLDQFRQPADVAHVLVIPRAHVENIYGIDDALGAELFAAHARLARAIKRAFAPDGITTWSSNGPGANQEIPHFHLHVWPRRTGVPFPPAIQPQEPPVPDEILGPSAERIRRALEELKGEILEIDFHPASGEPTIVSASAEYERLWRADGERIVAKLIALTGLRFSERRVGALVHEGPSRSHPLRLRASYDRDTKLGTLIHELAHRLVAGGPRPDAAPAASGREHHQLIYLFLFDAWSDLYGEAFARRQVEVESLRRPVYAEAWQVALLSDRSARAAALRSLLTTAPPVQ